MNNLLDHWRHAIQNTPSIPGTLTTPAWSDDEVVVRLDNISNEPLCPREWLLLDQPVAEPDWPIYGEGFQMLAQTAGRWGAPQPIGRCPDAEVYRITADEGYHTVHNLLMFKAQEQWTLLAFTGCERFGGEFRLFPDGRLQVLMRTESVALRPGSHWLSEPLLVMQGRQRGDLLARLAQRIARHHPPVCAMARPTGWCSWYHYYADVSADDIRENLQQIQQRFPELRYVQIDDGYQAAMGDWLTPSDRFDGGLQPVVEAIHASGAEPALWVAPFIAEPGSRLFQDHPEWFIRDEHGQPLAAETVTYGGWRCTPWYVLDGSHPEVQAHLSGLFSTLRHRFGIRYFKLDANFWGAIHGGKHHDPQATRISAYRRGMQAIIDGAGEGAFLLGCNAPIWPSLGLVQGMRVADDIERSGHRIRQVAREIFARSWQGERLWQLDPDCLCLHDLSWQHASQADYEFHMTTLLACGGMILSGDRLRDLNPRQSQWLQMLIRMAEGRAPAADFCEDLSYGEMVFDGKRWSFFFNWHAEAQRLVLPAGGELALYDAPAPDEYLLPPGGALVVTYRL